MNMKWRAVLLMALLTSLNTQAFELHPDCHEYYEMIQSPDLSYEDVGRIAEGMYHKQCWPAMQGTPPSQTETSGGLPSCEYLGKQLVNGSTNIRKLLDVRPMRESDCGEVDERCSDPEWSSIDPQDSYYNKKTTQAWLNKRGRECNRSTARAASNLWTNNVTLRLNECDLLVSNPAQFAEQRPELGLRPVNCRGKILYADGSKFGFYFYMEQYSDGDRGVWGENVSRWQW